jgi:hypothetical protein
MAFRLAARPRALKFIGDSHAARFDGLVLHDDDGATILTQAHNHYGFRATEFSYDDGTLNERLVRSLLTLNVLRGTRENAIPELGRFRTAREPLGWEFGLRVRESFRDEVVVISCGEVDARDIIRRLPLDARIAPPDDARIALPDDARAVLRVPMPAFPDDPPATADAVPHGALAEEIAREYLAPLFRGLRTLHAIGLPNLYVLSLPPPGPSDADYEAHCGFASRRHVRYAVHRTIDLLLASYCAHVGIGFLDSWPLVTGSDGALLAAYGSDSVHLNRDAAALIAADLAQRTAATPPPDRDPLR